MERFILFDRPVKLDLRPRNYNEVVIVPVWGFSIPDIQFTSQQITDYLTYIRAITKWEDEGNLVVANEWIKDGVIYQAYDEEITEYIRQCQSEVQVNFTLWMTEEHIDRNGFFYEFIIDPEIRDAIEKEGRCLDVQTGPSTENE